MVKKSNNPISKPDKRTLLLKGDDDERHEDVDEEEGKDDEEDDVIKGQLDPKMGQRSKVFVRRVHGPLQNRGPSFTSLHREKRQHGCHHIVVVEFAPHPYSPVHVGRLAFVSEHEVLALAFLLHELGLVSAEPKAAVEQLHGDDGEDELKEHVHDQDVEYVLQGGYHAVKDGLKRSKTQIRTFLSSLTLHNRIL